MATAKTRQRIEQLIWVLIYGGLFAVALGIATGRTEPATGWAIAVPGGIAAAVGIVLIYVRSRFKENP